MGKVIITNRTECIDSLYHKNNQVGFKLSKRNCIGPLSLLLYKKLKVDNTNYRDFENGDFVATTGTLIYKGQLGADALTAIGKDFEGDVVKLRQNLLGNYLILIKKTSYIYIFGEEDNLFDVFYYSEANDWAISNSLGDLYYLLRDRLSVNELNSLELCFQNTIIGSETIFNETKRLQGDEIIILNTTDNSIRIVTLKPNKAKRLNNKDLVATFGSKINQSAKVINHCFKNITLCITGGLDSRIVLASLLSQQGKPRLNYGVGDSFLTGTKNRDLEISRMLAKYFDLPLKIMNWHSPQQIDKYWQYYFDKYGFHSLIYGASNNIFESFENMESTEFIDFGYFGENFRNIPWIENIKGDIFTLNQYLDDFYINSDLQLMLPNYKVYRDSLYNRYYTFCLNNSIDPDCILKNQFQILHNEYRKVADSRLLNFTNLLCYSSSILASEGLIKLSEQIEVKDKVNAKFMLKVLSDVFPDILNVPIFSHGKDYTFNSSALELQSYQKITPSLLLLKKRIKDVIPNRKFYDVIRKIKARISNADNNITAELDKRIAAEKFCFQKLKTSDNSKFDFIRFKGSTACLVGYIQLKEALLFRTKSK